VWNTLSNTVIFQIQTNRGIATTEFSRDSQRIAVLYSPPAPVEVYELASGVRVCAIKGIARAWGIRFDPDGRRLAVTYSGNTNAEILDLKSQQVLHSLPHPKPVVALAWHPEGDLLVTSCRDTHVYVWDAGTGKLRNVLRGHQSEVIGLDFNHRGDLLVTSGWDGIIRLWDPLGMILTVRMACESRGFSPDDRRILCAFAKGRYGFAEVADGAECRVLHSDIEPGK